MVEAHAAGMTETLSEVVAAFAFLIGLCVAYLFHLQKRSLAEAGSRESGRSCPPRMVVCRLGV